MEEKIRKLVLNGDFLEAVQLIPLIDYQILSDALMTIVFEHQNICSYTFVSILLGQKETVGYHGLAMDILIHGFPFLEGSYAAAMYHVKRSLELDSNNIGLKEVLLFFNDVPYKPLKDIEAKKIALEILKVEKDNYIANKILKRLTKAKK